MTQRDSYTAFRMDNAHGQPTDGEVRLVRVRIMQMDTKRKTSNLFFGGFWRELDVVSVMPSERLRQKQKEL